MTAGAFTFIGVLFFAAAFKPILYLRLLPLLSLFMVCEGFILLVAGIASDLFFIPYIIDSGFCLLIGSGLFMLSRKINGGIKTS